MVSSGTQRSALLVDDDLLVRCVADEMLDVLGFAVTAVSSGQQALELLGSGDNFDLLVTDIRMPGIDGWTLAECAREVNPTLSVLYITGYHAESARPVPKSGVLRKPFDLKSLENALSDTG